MLPLDVTPSSARHQQAAFPYAFLAPLFQLPICGQRKSGKDAGSFRTKF